MPRRFAPALLLTLLFLVPGAPLSAQSILAGPESASVDPRLLVHEWYLDTAAGERAEPDVAFEGPRLDPLRFTDDVDIGWQAPVGLTLMSVGLVVTTGGLLWAAVGEFHPVPIAMGAAAAVTGWVLLPSD